MLNKPARRTGYSNAHDNPPGLLIGGRAPQQSTAVDESEAAPAPRDLARFVDHAHAPSADVDTLFLNAAGDRDMAGDLPSKPLEGTKLVHQAPPSPFSQALLDHPSLCNLDAASAFDYARAFLNHQRLSGTSPTPGSPGAALTRDLKAAVAAAARYEYTALRRMLLNPNEVMRQVVLVMARHARGLMGGG